jgi:hypothetical protein
VQTIWHYPTDFVTGHPTLRIEYPHRHASVDVTCTTPGDLQWVEMGLSLPEEVRISEVVICYSISNVRSFISQVRLVEMTTPDHATVLHDDGTDLTSTIPVCYTSVVRGIRTTGAIALALRLNFQDTADTISLGAVGVRFEPSP